MKALYLAALISISIFGASNAEAKGCIKGAVVGGIAGKMAGHGGVGAAAGCAVGSHRANKKDKQAQPQGGAQPAPELRADA
jgi:outer membrane lipoprotein SlyB